MNFKRWLFEVGMGGGGAGGGMEPPKQDPTQMSGAWATYSSPSEADPSNQNGQLPPTKSRKTPRKKAIKTIDNIYGKKVQ